MADAGGLQRQMVQAVQRKDFDALRSLYADDYVYTGGDGVEQAGADAGVAIARKYTAAFPDVTFEIRNQYLPSPDVAIMELRARGTHRGELEGIAATGRQVDVVLCNIVEARGGKVVREREYADGLSLLQQLGVLGGEPAAT